LGPFPEITLSAARSRAIDLRGAILRGEDPIKRIDPSKEDKPIVPTFFEFAEDYITQNQDEWKNKKHIDQWRNTLRDYVYPLIGSKLLDEINTDDLLNVLRPIWKSKTETATRIRGRIERILSAATSRQLRYGPNPASWRGHLDNLLPTIKKSRRVKHHAAMPHHLVKEFIRKLREKDCISALALEFLILTSVRTSEALYAKWSEINEDVWVIPEGRMKAEKEHRVPLTSRCLTILNLAKSLAGESEFIFHKNGRPLSNMAMANVLKRIHPEYTVHGFRSTFRDWVSEETEYSGELAEMALAHTIGNRVESAYRRGDLLNRRRFMMDSWLQYCENGTLSCEAIGIRRAV
jgi:integrase